ncbi:MAG: SUMF1/EgtB/PvdO family nonheme iron enzyme [Verrucomicrobia bacterium]|nr:SUMF1/EgtB/PvdO family nonheme iron enzyme [Verrucomicrobiota bacterium]
MTSLEGQTFAGFEVVAKLGQGGMGAVYKARQPLLDRFVALKVMSQQLSGDPGYIARFIREAASAAKLNHPNMVQVYTAGEQGGVYYIVMEFVEGESLNQRLKRVGALDPVEAIAITLHVATALQCAWNEARLIHRDIKPDNIFLSNKGGVKVGDLGLAKSVSGGATEMTQSGMMMGSPHYISPEQARASKETDFRADIYSLGCTLYQLLTGTTPYQADEALAVVLKHVTDPTPDLSAVMPNCPQVLAALAGKMMAKDPNQRHASYEELMAELWRASDLIGQQQSAATAMMTPTPAPAAATLKPTAVKAATVVPTVKPTMVRDSKPVIRDSRFVIGGVAAVAVLLLGGLFLWSPWKSRIDEQGRREDAKTEAPPSSSQSSTTPSLQHSAALQLLGNVFTNSVGAEMVYIPPGEFMLGSTPEEQAWAVANGLKQGEVKHEGEAPRKAAIKQGFWMGRTEVTVGQWKQFVKETGYVTDGEKKGESYVQQGPGKSYAPMKGKSWQDPNFGFEPQDDHSVSCISWNDAKAFCEWLDGREQQAGRLAHGYVVRLPTEAEWEYACRAGRATKFWWGDSKEDGNGRLNLYGKDDGYEFVAPVDSYDLRGRNRFGLADMLGNVYEWCLDEYDVTQAHEDLWTGNFGARVLRGGSFHFTPATCRCASRLSNPPSYSRSNNGFRVAVGVARTLTATTSTSPTAAPKETGVLAPPETRVFALTTNPKVGEVFTLNVGSNVTMELMGIPPGEFMLGSTKEERAWAVAISGKNDRTFDHEGQAPRKAAIKAGGWMGRTEVTVGQWKQFVNATGYKTESEKNGYVNSAPIAEKRWGQVNGLSWCDPGFGSPPKDDHPVCCMSWNDAKAFCKWLTEQERKAGRLPAGCVIRLPTEAEWEYACRAGTQTKFWWGESKEDGKGRLNWFGSADGFEFASPVDHYGALGRNKFGLADMLGNLYEWCLDEFDEREAHEECYKGRPRSRVMRGGSFGRDSGGVRCANRNGKPLAESDSRLGFRVYCGVDVVGATTPTASPSPAAAPKEGGILGPPETRVAALTTNPKVGEVFTLAIGSNVTMELMGIPPGEFMMGNTKEEQVWANANGLEPRYTKHEGEQPRKAVIKQGFWLGRTEVTVGQWKQFVAETGYVTDGEKKGEMYVPQEPGGLWGQVKGASWKNPNFGALPHDSHPVCCMSWNDAVAFCEWLSNREQKAGQLPPGFKVRLPTEAESEYACRAGAQAKFWWGDSVEDGEGRLNWGGTEDGFLFVSPVDYYGARGRNKFGLADILGNVREWCLDEFDPAGAHEEFWTGNPSIRVVRGGTFYGCLGIERCAYRGSYAPSSSHGDLGFRVCCGVSR